MIKKRHVGICLCIALLISTVVPRPAHAEDGGHDRRIRLYATEQFGPIGRVYSLGAFVIDGRSTFGEQAIWGGELIHTTPDSSVNVDMDLVGRITLKNAATARLATTLTSGDDATERHLFVASLIDGDMAVRLQPDAVAYIESCGSAFTSSGGARFKIRVRDGQPLIDSLTGAVSIETLPPATTFKGRAAQKGPGNIPVPAAETPLNVKANETRRVLTLWSKLIPRTSSLTKTFSPRLVTFSTEAQQPELPAANRRVHFEVEGSVGTIDPIEKETEADGSVEVTFTAGPNGGSGKIRAWVLPAPGDPGDTDYQKYERTVIVTKSGVFTRQNQLIGAAAVATVIVIAARPKKGPIQQQPPAVVISRNRSVSD